MCIRDSYITDDGTQRKDCLDFILKHNEKNPREAFSDDEIIDNCLTFFIGGMDTTSRVITFSIYYLLEYPSIKDRIVSEFQNLGVPVSKLTTEDIGKLKYLDAFLKEVLRVGTPTIDTMPRSAKSTHNLCDLKVLKGTVVKVGLNAVGFRESDFPQAFEFKPERWLDEEECSRRNPFAYIPFSAGSGHCIGKYIAAIEAKLVILHLLNNFKVSLSDKDYEMKKALRFVYEPVSYTHLTLPTIYSV
eukprot:TRINITY_DN2845_c0_g1_i5.p1 TRINITY_DN2845_c0_g1~~TRINITY_DN2845_c0_g1_i5.p1  ORF type:complete len:261 (-),score=56.53 TRINITY_DN2845_c0_g1_i5:35-769(-)